MFAGTFEFTRQNGWKQLPSLYSQYDEGTSLEDILSDKGYSYREKIGEREDVDGLGDMWVHSTENLDGEYPYAVLINHLYDHYFVVFVPTIPDLFALASDIYPMWHMKSKALQDNWMEELFRKWFHADHGHDVNWSCRECDPVAYERRMEAQVKRRAEQAAKR